MKSRAVSTFKHVGSSEAAPKRGLKPLTPHEGTTPLTAEFFRRDPLLVAPDLIGALFTVDGVGGVIVETEAYDETDPASHCYLGKRTALNGAMFGPPGNVYVYRSYGIHWCVNFVCGEEGVGNAVLVRAIAPLWGLAKMRRRRGTQDEKLLCNGPGRLCQALRITGALNDTSLFEEPFQISRPQGEFEVVCGPRIGITRGEHHCWRFGLKDSKALSRPFRSAPARH